MQAASGMHDPDTMMYKLEKRL